MKVDMINIQIILISIWYLQYLYSTNYSIMTIIHGDQLAASCQQTCKTFAQSI